MTFQPFSNPWSYRFQGALRNHFLSTRKADENNWISLDTEKITATFFSQKADIRKSEFR